MSTEVKKRGRPKKVVEEMAMPVAEKIPRTSAASKLSKPSTKAASTTSRTTSRSNGSAKARAEKKSLDIPIDASTASSGTIERKSIVAEESPPPPVVAKLIQAEESRILQEIANTKTKRQRKPISEPVVLEKPAVQKAIEILPPLKEQSNTLAAHLQPTNTLAMGLPIPSHQSTMRTVGLHASHCIPWLPNPSNLMQAAYLSTTTPLQAPSNRKLRSTNEANKSGAMHATPGASSERPLRAQGASRPELLQHSEMPAKYKPAMRRVQAIIVALPIVIVTSYMLYERRKSTQ